MGIRSGRPTDPRGQRAGFRGAGVKACRLGNGDLMVVYSHGVSAPGDSLSAMRYDTDGMPVWAMATSLVRDSVLSCG